MTTLAEFLSARLAEDERDARTAGGKPWRHDTYPEVVPQSDEIRESVGALLAELHNTEVGPHIARHDPARVLRDVEAKRRIIDEHSPWDGPRGYGWPEVACSVCVSMVMDEDAGGNRFLDLEHEPWPCPTLRLLALPYADHPDYRAEEWAP